MLRFRKVRENQIQLPNTKIIIKLSNHSFCILNKHKISQDLRQLSRQLVSMRKLNIKYEKGVFKNPKSFVGYLNQL